MKNIPLIVLSDDDSDAPVTMKRQRLEKNGAIVKKNYVQGEKQPRRTNQTTYQRMKNHPIIVISEDDDDELVLPITNKKAYGKEIQQSENSKNNEESKVGFNTNKKNCPGLDSKTPTKNLIDEQTDEEFWESVDLNEDFINLFDEEANEDAETKPETHT
ncbi:hypothetical protein Tco_0907969 [Tanacetum coccineum]|uniref:Uncharacterized protein n=1 Tax=Tanacetum coccineum TaxID=301880 RepID=A0ABQ5CLY0_9ASTR